jgi:hypothetical protein
VCCAEYNPTTAKKIEPTVKQSQSEILLAYLSENQPLTIGRLVSESKCGCLDRGYETIKKLIANGKIRRDDSVEPPELWVV